MICATIVPYPISLAAFDTLPTEQLLELIEQLTHRLMAIDNGHIADCDSRLRELLLGVADTGTSKH